MKSLVKDHADKPVTFISISTDRDRDKWLSFIEKNKMDWPQCLDNGLVRAFGVHLFPSFFVIDGEGIIVEGRYGADTVSFGIKKALKSLGKSQAATAAKPAQS